MLEKIKAGIAWLNEVPGRKRGIAAALLGISAALRVLGHSQLADQLVNVNDFAQSYLVPGADLIGGIMAVWGLGTAKKL